MNYSILGLKKKLSQCNLLCAVLSLGAIPAYALDCNTEGVYSIATVADLRAAVDCGNTYGSANISLAAGTYDLSADELGNISVTDSTISITGDGQEDTILNGNGTTSFFDMYLGNLILEQLTLKNGYGYNGGAVHGSYSSITITDSTLSDNAAYASSGAIYGSYSSITISNSTLSDNTANAGGAIYGSKKIIITNSTLSGNTANDGDAIYAESTVKLKNTILNSENNCFLYGDASVFSYGYNLATDASCGLTAEGDQENIDPMLDELADNGGSTMTHALLEGSPAIDAIPIENCVDLEGNPINNDQRGVRKPERQICDSGAYEAEGTDVGFYAETVIVTENDTYTYATLKVMAEADMEETTTFGYWTADGTAVKGSDYYSKSGTFVIREGTFYNYGSVKIKGDNTKESEEYFYYNIEPDSDTVTCDSRSTEEILNDDYTNYNCYARIVIKDDE